MSGTVCQVRDAIRAGEKTATVVVGEALEQIARVNPELRAVLEVYDTSAREEAATIDCRLAQGENVGPLAGVPYTVKGNICTPQGTTSAGSRILETFRSPYSATVVERLRQAGAICVGKTNLDEFGMGSSTENSAFGPTCNPWKTTHVPGGSSGGAAALSAATRGMIHLGSDTGGSIRQPASYCGVTGFKPTYGHVSRYGLVAFASSLDQIGVLQANAADAALALGVIAGHDPLDSTSAERAVPSYEEEIGASIKGMRLGIAPELFPDGVEGEVRHRVEQAIAVLQQLGATTHEIEMPHLQYANQVYVLISAAEASSNLARFDGVHYGHRTPDPAGVQELYSESRAEGFGPEVKRRVMVGTFVLSAGYYDAFYNKACKVRQLIRRDFDSAYDKVDAVVCPTSPVTAFPMGDRLDDPLKLYAVDVLTVPANLASVPGISIPCGLTGAGLPVGLQLFGRPFEDGTLLRLAHAYQSQTDHHTQAPAAVCGWS
jgi:aspartyl-tRNA(Asn)/glutamyl-tRNA(Gln) amidotransferase subunit A